MAVGYAGLYRAPLRVAAKQLVAAKGGTSSAALLLKQFAEAGDLQALFDQLLAGQSVVLLDQIAHFLDLGLTQAQLLLAKAELAVAAAQLQMFLVELATAFPEIGNGFFKALMLLGEQAQVLLELGFPLAKLATEGGEFFFLFGPLLGRLDQALYLGQGRIALRFELLEPAL